MEQATIAMRDIGDAALGGRDGEIAFRLDRHLAHMDAFRFATGHDGLHDIARLKAEHDTRPFALGAWESPFVHQAHLPVVPALRLDEQGNRLAPAESLWRAGADAVSIQPMGFRDTACGAIPFRAPAGAGLHRQPDDAQFLVEPPADTVHRRRVLQWLLRLLLDSGEPKLRCRFGILVLIAFRAGERQIGHPVAATATLGNDVFDLQRDVDLVAVGATPSPLFEQVLTKLISEQRALLVSYAINLRVGKRLGIEFDQLE